MDPLLTRNLTSNPSVASASPETAKEIEDFLKMGHSKNCWCSQAPSSPDSDELLQVAADSASTTTKEPLRPPASADGFPKFIALPRELRNLIYEFYLRAEPYNMGWCGKDHSNIDKWQEMYYSWPNLIVEDGCRHKNHPRVFPKFVPSIFAVNKQVRNEAADFMLTKVFVTILSTERAVRFTKFLESFEGEWAFGLVKELNFPKMYLFDGMVDGRRYGGNPAVQLMLRCNNLRRVHLTFLHGPLVTIEPTSEFNDPRAIDDVLDYFMLRPIVQCTALEAIYLDAIDKFAPLPPHEWRFDPIDAMKKFGIRFKESFTEKNRKVEVWVKRPAERASAYRRV